MPLAVLDSSFSWSVGETASGSRQGVELRVLPEPLVSAV